MTQAAAPPEKHSIISRVATVLLVLFSGLLWYHILWFLATGPQPFEEMFDRFGIRAGLPVPTRALIGASHVVTTYWYVFGVLGVVAIVWLMWAGLTKRCVGRLAILAAASFGAAWALGILMWAGLLMPLIKLIEAVGAAD